MKESKQKKTCLVEDGILKGFIYDIYTAKKENSNKNGADDIKSTANGFRGSYAGTPSVSPSNIIFDFKEQVDISEIENGFFSY
ncbi:metallopeptidase TldD-related protein [Methanobrevibacter arboriphilus]|uniref:metallopeptidase TldD-related protein n=1 Tax=Methanobrevibacter arboriphilus TaxID=39441 RepID=UPI0021E69600|nr:metallopeptidase TldD-related protein [Methanobrevibacter arboriphilus]